jgi:hypothetical protein
LRGRRIQQTAARAALFQNGGGAAAAVNFQIVVRFCLKNGMLAREEGAFPVTGDCSDHLNLTGTIDEGVSFHCVFFNGVKKNLLPLSQRITPDPRATIANLQDGDRSCCLTLGDLFSQIIPGEKIASREEACPGKLRGTI